MVLVAALVSSSLPPPESVADAFLQLALPECQRNGDVVDASDLTDTQSQA